MSKQANDIIPKIDLDSKQRAQNDLYANFMIIRDALKNGKDGTITAGGHTLTFTKGILTDFV